ncbi:maleylpyruvate isomerase family mycothiol-dependent enzyme [Microbispora sp. NPDC049125]|uniref:maleylpyruvate isomerase family mycothiol-dependent enzyme n=1 Tax=Microbispora sp. NPDC049125 TaxID=3154929 RepID=UPI0034658835
MTSGQDPLAGLDPFEILDIETGRLDRFFSTLDEAGWERPSRCEGWTVRDVLAHLAGEELYNHACLDGDIEGFFELLEREGVRGGFDEFNEWSVRKHRGRPVEQVLDDWRAKNAETRRRMRELGRDGTLQTSAGPYSAGLQAFHYDSEYATHADDVGAPVAEEDTRGRLGWRVAVGMFVLEEQGAKARAERADGDVRVRVDGLTVEMPAADFVQATVGRLPASSPLDPRVRSALRCLA